MTLAEIERAEKSMQQQWYDLVMAEQHGESLEVLEQMYDTYILLAEEYNRSLHPEMSSQSSHKVHDGNGYFVGRVK